MTIPLGINGAVKVKRLRSEIKAECRRRIIAVMGQSAQGNLSSAASLGELSAPDLETYRQTHRWIMQMRRDCTTMSVDADFTNDTKWPNAPDGARVLAAYAGWIATRRSGGVPVLVIQRGYERILGDENAELAEWLVKLTSNRRTWGFGLCFSLTGRLLQGNDREVVFA